MNGLAHNIATFSVLHSDRGYWVRVEHKHEGTLVGPFATLKMAREIRDALIADLQTSLAEQGHMSTAVQLDDDTDCKGGRERGN